ncbi:MAG: PHB depolymerase family esterase [Anaerolineales bacterium]|nr:PHB depolymerase family esterase [Anaerolineales bacterium]
MIKTSGRMEFGGYERSYVLLTPAAIDPDETYPLVLALHGGGGSGERMCSLKGGIQELAAQQDLIVACPSGIDKHWNDGRQTNRSRAHAEDIDDVGFLLELVSQLVGQHPVDPGRVYVTGMSNGGMMSLRMACEASAVFRAAAPVISSLPADLDCEPSNPISILIMNGTEDPLVPWEGGEVRAFLRPLGAVLSTPETVRYWVERNRCDPQAIAEWLPDRTMTDESRIEVARYMDCAEGASVALFTVHGAGHTWPGGSQYLPVFLIGATNGDIHAGQAIWDFFASRSL